MKSVVTIVGARPQFIKVAPVSRALEKIGLKESIIHTGQHHDDVMSQVFFDQLHINRPAYNLNVHEKTHGKMTARMLEGIEKVLIAEQPACVLVYGDTNSTLAGALAASKLSIPIMHVEAGLRSNNRDMPEEVNRILTDHLSTLLFCPSKVSVDNLMAEGITKGVHTVGDVMVEASHDAIRKVEECPDRYSSLIPKGLTNQGFGLLTLHRPQNTDDPARLRQLVSALNALEMPLVFPVHPRTSKCLYREGISLREQIYQIEPLGYLEMMATLSKCSFVITDSGGLQKEAYWAKKPCLTIRPETEWLETIFEGWNRLVTDEMLNDLSEQVHLAIDNIPDSSPHAYGDGTASKKIAELSKILVDGYN